MSDQQTTAPKEPPAGTAAQAKPFSRKRAAAIPTDDVELNNLLGSEGLNLSTLRIRIEELQKALHGSISALQFNAAAVTWQDMLGQLAVINVQFQCLADEFRPHLKQYIAHPIFVSAECNADLPPLLSAKLLPEMEEEDSNLISEYQKSVIGQTDVQKNNLEMRIARFNNNCEAAYEEIQTMRKALKLKQHRTEDSKVKPAPSEPSDLSFLRSMLNGEGLR